jgi:hypothetical protein
MKIVIVAVLIHTTRLACIAQTPCDSDLITNLRDNDRYLQRGADRCEGVYLQQVAGTVGDILVASLTCPIGGLTHWPASGALTLRWNRFSGSDVHIQAFPVVPRKHFRLDVVKGSIDSYEWHTDLAEKYLAPAEAGLVVWTVTPINGRNQRVYLPLAIGSSGTPRGPYRLALVPPVELSEVYLTVASTASGTAPLLSKAPLKFGSYPANQKIAVELPPLPKAGLYRVEIVADRKDQGSVATQPFLLNHVQ